MGDMSPEEILALTEEASRRMEGGEEDFSLPSPEPAPEPGMARKAQDTLYGPVTQGERGPELTSSLSSLGDLAKSGAEKFMGALGAPKGLMADSPAYAAMLIGPPEWPAGLASGPAAQQKLAAPPQRENAAGQLMGKAARAIGPVEPVSMMVNAKDRAMDELASLQQRAQQEGRSSDAFQYQKLQEMLDNAEGIGSALLTDPMMMSGSFLRLLRGAPKAAQFLGGAVPGLGRLLGLGAKASVPVMAADAAGRVAGSAMDEGSRAAALPELPDAALQSFFLAKQGKGLKEQRDADKANALPGIRKGLHIKHPLPLEERVAKFTNPKKSPDQVSRVNDLVAKFSRLFSLWSGTGGTNVRANLGNVARFGQHEAATPATSLRVLEGLLREKMANKDPSLPYEKETRPLGDSFTEADLLARLDGQGLTPQDVRTVFTLLNQEGFIQKGSTRGSGGEVSYSIRDPKAVNLLLEKLQEVVPAETTIRDEAHAAMAKEKQRSGPPIKVAQLEPPPKVGKGSRTAAKKAKLSEKEYAARGDAARPPAPPELQGPPEPPPGTPGDLVQRFADPGESPKLDIPPPLVDVPPPLDAAPPPNPGLPPPPVSPSFPGQPGTKQAVPPPGMAPEGPIPPTKPDPLVPPKPFVPPKVELKPPPLHLSIEQKSYFLEKGIPLKKAQKLLDLGRDGAWEAMAADKTLKGLSPQARTAILRKLFAPSLAPPPGVGPHQVLKAPPPPKSEE